MYDVLVVDDEELICLGIKSMIERLRLADIGEVITAAGAADADALIRDHKPGIVITDIRMPDVDGLEMIKKLNMDPDKVRFIVLSGYDEFKYAREALKLGVMDYLLKPASIGELKTVLEKAVSSLDAGKRHFGSESEIKYRQLFIENNLSKLFLSERPNEYDVLDILGSVRHLFPHRDFYVGIIGVRNEQEDCTAPSVTEMIPDGEDHFRSGDGWLATGFYNYDREKVIVVNCAPNLSHEKIPGIVKEMAQPLKNSPDCSFTTALSARGSGIECLHDLYRQAGKALSYRVVTGHTEIIGYENVKNRPLNPAYAEHKLSEFSELLKALKADRVSNFVDEAFKSDFFANQAIECLSKLVNGMNRLSENMAVTNGLDMGDSFRTMESFASLKDIRIYFKEMVYRIFDAVKEAYNEKTVMSITMNYIRENLGRDISLAVAANKAGLSYTHFSRLFKMQTGMNFSDYLMKVRMEEAMKLLNEPGSKVYDISARVGYDDPKHFTRAFKMYFGISPKEHRTIHK